MAEARQVLSWSPAQGPHCHGPAQAKARRTPFPHGRGSQSLGQPGRPHPVAPAPRVLLTHPQAHAAFPGAFYPSPVTFPGSKPGAKPTLANRCGPVLWASGCLAKGAVNSVSSRLGSGVTTPPPPPVQPRAPWELVPVEEEGAPHARPKVHCDARRSLGDKDRVEWPPGLKGRKPHTDALGEEVPALAVPAGGEAKGP